MDEKNKKLNLIIISSISGITTIVISAIIFIVPILLILGILSGGSKNGTSGSIAYESECNYEETKVIVMDGNNTKILATVSLEDYIIGVACPEIGACDGNIKNMNENYIKTHYVATRTYVLARGRYNSNSKTVTVRAATRDQQWCDLETGCLITKTSHEVPGYPGNYFHYSYPGDYDKSKVDGNIYMTRSFTEEDLELAHKYYQETYGDLILSETYDGQITSLGEADVIEYKSSTQTYWSNQANAGKSYEEILNSTGNSGVSNSNYYKNKKIYKLGNYCKSSNTSSSGSTSINYVNWMIEFAADDTHGYSMGNRLMNPDVDCSSFVYYALLNNGYSASQLGGSYPFSTASMPNILISIGFEQIAFDINSLQEGDILWYPAGYNGHSYGHTEVYIGDGKSVGAHSNYDGKTGDSSGNEVSIVSVKEYKSIFRKK